jgi:hypothetical protein
METKVYGINVDEPHNIDNFDGASDSQWIAESEMQGWVWSLQGFQSAFNHSELPFDSLLIRILSE